MLFLSYSFASLNVLENMVKKNEKCKSGDLIYKKSRADI